MTQHRSSDGLLRIVVLVVALVVLLPFLLMAFMLPMMGMLGWGGGMMGGYGGMMGSGDWGGMMGGYGIWGFGMLLVWLLVLAGIGYAIYRGFAQSAQATTDPALAELRVQYARGELTDEEFEERRSRLTRDE